MIFLYKKFRFRRFGAVQNAFPDGTFFSTFARMTVQMGLIRAALSVINNISKKESVTMGKKSSRREARREEIRRELARCGSEILQSEEMQQAFRQRHHTLITRRAAAG